MGPSMAEYGKSFLVKIMCLSGMKRSLKNIRFIKYVELHRFSSCKQNRRSEINLYECMIIVDHFWSRFFACLESIEHKVHEMCTDIVKNSWMSRTPHPPRPDLIKVGLEILSAMNFDKETRKCEVIIITDYLGEKFSAFLSKKVLKISFFASEGDSTSRKFIIKTNKNPSKLLKCSFFR